jgi:hypothetical protein
MKTITAVPESITRATYVAMVESLGFVVDDVLLIEFSLDGIYAEVVARDERGKVIVRRNELARDRIFIPVVDPEQP